MVYMAVDNIIILNVVQRTWAGVCGVSWVQDSSIRQMLNVYPHYTLCEDTRATHIWEGEADVAWCALTQIKSKNEILDVANLSSAKCTRLVILGK